MSGDDTASQFTNNVSRLTTYGTGGSPFTNDLKVIKQHLMDNKHPIKILMKEFNNAFLYINRNLLYTEKCAHKQTTRSRKETSS